MTTNGEGAEMEARGPPSLHLSTRNGNFGEAPPLGRHFPAQSRDPVPPAHQALKMLPGTGGSNVSAALIVGNGGHTKALLIFFNTGAVFDNELMMSLTHEY
ncbi:hypothetical protein MUK42_33383 [Musa troglodytarum]|uniref:Uncharacterized protein n=1 Tax=Musa troglodytarum TaxID=320322 RepID=A0A9E7HR85_9LILI|nr:hypothetical protein MUK42_33383 [Musa troglodytarum]